MLLASGPDGVPTSDRYTVGTFSKIDLPRSGVPNTMAMGMKSFRTAIRTTLALTTAASAFFALGPVSTASAEPNPCAGRSDGGTGGDRNGGLTPDHEWNKRIIWGIWYNCSGGTGADRVRLVISTDTDGPCITVPYGTLEYSEVVRKYKVWAPHYDGWKRC